jgi:hypothetical protein
VAGRARAHFVVCAAFKFPLILFSSLHGAGGGWECDRRGRRRLPLHRQEEHTKSSGTCFYSASLFNKQVNDLSILRLFEEHFTVYVQDCVESNLCMAQS